MDPIGLQVVQAVEPAAVVLVVVVIALLQAPGLLMEAVVEGERPQSGVGGGSGGLRRLKILMRAFS
ncbi:MAG: hypothetical protein AAF889_00120 [Cyanobacteria bacterium P01_D01_bin.73]